MKHARGSFEAGKPVTGAQAVTSQVAGDRVDLLRL